MHELTSAAEVRRLFGPRIDEAIKVDVPGMEIGTQHKYVFNILIDFKPEDSPLRPEAEEAMRRRGAPAELCTGIPGLPCRRSSFRADQDRAGAPHDRYLL